MQHPMRNIHCALAALLIFVTAICASTHAEDFLKETSSSSFPSLQVVFGDIFDYDSNRAQLSAMPRDEFELCLTYLHAYSVELIYQILYTSGVDNGGDLNKAYVSQTLSAFQSMSSDQKKAAAETLFFNNDVPEVLKQCRNLLVIFD